MKNIILITSLLIVVIFVGCQKENLFNSETIENSTTDLSVELRSTEYDSLGILHNFYLDTIMKDIAATASTTSYISDSIKSVLENHGYTFDDDYVSPTYQEYVNTADSIIVSNLSSNEAIAYHNEIYKIAYEAISVHSLRNDLNQLENVMISDNTISANDLDILRSELIVVMYSFKFWAPVSIGGEGGFDIYANGTTPNITYAGRGWSWRKCLLGDGLGAGSGMIGAAITVGVLGGPAGTAIVAGTVASAVFGSVYGGAGVP